MTLAPVRLSEAADSLVKASTPQPFSTSKTSNWVARLGGLPDYIQHVAHGILRSDPAGGVSGAIQKAVGVVKNWATGVGKHVDANTRAAAAKAVAEWEKLKAENKAKGAVKESWIEEADRYRPTWGDERLVEQDALARIAIYEQQFGRDGLINLLVAGPLMEAASWSPTMKRVAKAPQEIERHEVYDGAQHVGTIAARRPFDAGKPARWKASDTNGRELSDYNCTTKADALKAIQTHLEEAPARVIAMPTLGKFFVANPSTYGDTTYKAYPTEQAARQSAGLPPAPTVPEQNSKVEAVAEALRFDLMSVSGLDIPPLAAVQEARRRDPFDLLTEGFVTGELRNFRGEWEGGGAHVARLTPHSVAPIRSSRGPGLPSERRYGGGVARMSSDTRSRLSGMFTAAERKTAAVKPQQPSKDLNELYRSAPAHQREFEGILSRVQRELGAARHSTATADDFRDAQAKVAQGAAKPHVIVAALKGKDRASEKVRDKYGGDARRLTDLVRGTVLVPHVDDLPKSIEAIRKSLPKGWTISNPENRFTQESGDKVNTGALGSGYRDVAVLLRAPDGFHAELQINTTHMWVAKEVSGGHTLYEQRRQIAEQATHRALTGQEVNRIRRLDAKARDLYAPALARSVRSKAINAALARRQP